MDWWEEKGKWFDCFFILGLSEDASESEIKHAYHELAIKYHPDGKEGDAELFRRIKKAYDTLKDEQTRTRYTVYTKKLREEQENKDKKQANDEEPKTFKDIVEEYKKSERQIKFYVNHLIHEVEQKCEKFFSIYDEFCRVLKSKKISADDFEIRRQKLRSLELSSINSVREIEKIIEDELKSMNLEDEEKRLKDFEDKFRETEDILISSYTEAIIRLNVPRFKIGKIKLAKLVPYATMLVVGLITIGLFFYNPEDTEKSEDLTITFEDDDEELLVFDGELETDLEDDENISLESEIIENEDLDCILFQSVPDDMEFDEISSPYHMGPYEVVSARKDGIGYIINTENNEVIISNYLSHGPALYEDGRMVRVFLSVDGYDYTLDASDLRTIINVESAYSYESEPYYLEGYGYVIEAMCCGEKYLIDAETRYPFIRNFDSYEPMYYDEEFDCNVYCFNKYDGKSKYYLAANDLKKVLKIENSWEEN